MPSPGFASFFFLNCRTSLSASSTALSGRTFLSGIPKPWTAENRRFCPKWTWRTTSPGNPLNLQAFQPQNPNQSNTITSFYCLINVIQCSALVWVLRFWPFPPNNLTQLSSEVVDQHQVRLTPHFPVFPQLGQASRASGYNT